MPALTDSIKQILARMYRYPEHIPEQDRLGYMINSYVLVYVFIGHITYTPLFYLIRNDIVLYNNIACIFLDIVLIWLNLRGNVKLATVICFLEVSYHASFGVIAYGWNAGFFYYYLAISCYFFFSNVRFIIKGFLVGGLFALNVFLFVYMLEVPPLSIVDPVYIIILHVGNAIACFAAVSYFASFYLIMMRRAELALKLERNDLKIKNEKIKSELKLAKKLQQQLIPLNNPRSYIYSFYKPMELIGGDFIDFVIFDDPEQLGIFISDVSGHGVPAAFITSMIKTIIIEAGATRKNPADLLHKINQILYKQIGGNFVTAFYGIYNQSTRSFVFSNAGHNPPFVILNSGVSRLICPHSVPIAVFDNEQLVSHERPYVNNEMILPVGGKLLMYTDGLTEASRMHDRDCLFEYESLVPALMENKHLPCDAFVMNLVDTLVEFRGMPEFDDDICLVCMDVH